VVEAHLAQNRRVVYGDSEDTEMWSSVPLDRIKGIILTLPDFDLRCAAITQLRNRGFRGQIGTICYYQDEQEELLRLGASFVIHPLIEAGNQMAEHMLQSD